MGLTTKQQLRGARAMLGWTQRTLAEKSGVSLPTIKRLETEEGELAVRFDTLRKLQAALESAGVEFIDENGGGPGVRLMRAGS